MSHTMADVLRVDMIRRAQARHRPAYAGVKTEHRAEEWRCKCGVGFTGDGAIEQGRRHEAYEILAALDGGAA